MPISDATREEAAQLVQRYPLARSALLPLLHLVHSDEGFVSDDGIAFCAEAVGLTRAEVGSVATFYTMYKHEPFGDYLLSVCTNPTCKIAGGQAIYESYLEACRGHVDADAGVMVEHVECLGICDAAPVVQVNYEMYGPLTTEQAADLLDKTRAGDPPPSNLTGEVPPPIRAVHRELSGIDDGVDEYLIEAARLQVAAEVPPADRSGETDIFVTQPGGDPRGHGGALVRDEQATTAGPAAADGDLTPTEGDDAAPVEADVDDADETDVVEDVAESTTGVGHELAEAALDDEPGDTETKGA